MPLAHTTRTATARTAVNAASPTVMTRALQILRDRLDARRVLNLEQSPFAVL